MSKELEALNKMRADIVEFGDNGGYIRTKNEDIDIIIKALTPPTADEVCKALGEWFGYKIKKTQDWNDFYYDWNLNGENGITTIVGDNSGKVKFYKIILPPHLIILIGRFYSSLGGQQ